MPNRCLEITPQDKKFLLALDNGLLIDAAGNATRRKNVE
jgi:hypothetical protein